MSRGVSVTVFGAPVSNFVAGGGFTSGDEMAVGAIIG